MWLVLLSHGFTVLLVRACGRFARLPRDFRLIATSPDAKAIDGQKTDRLGPSFGDIRFYKVVTLGFTKHLIAEE